MMELLKLVSSLSYLLLEVLYLLLLLVMNSLGVGAKQSDRSSSFSFLFINFSRRMSNWSGGLRELIREVLSISSAE